MKKLFFIVAVLALLILAFFAGAVIGQSLSTQKNDFQPLYDSTKQELDIKTGQYVQAECNRNCLSNELSKINQDVDDCLARNEVTGSEDIVRKCLADIEDHNQRVQGCLDQCG